MAQNDRFWSKVIPRYLIDEVDSMDVPEQVICRLDCDLSFCLDPNKIDSVLPKCNDNLLSTDLWLTYSISSVNAFSTTDKLLPDTRIPESSAYKINLFLTTADISFT